MGFQQELMKVLQNPNPEKQIVLKHLQEKQTEWGSSEKQILGKFLPPCTQESAFCYII